jgi:hypothetical protein
LAGLALIVAISDPAAGHTITRRHWLQVAAAVGLAFVVLVVDSASAIGLPTCCRPRCSSPRRSP